MTPADVRARLAATWDTAAHAPEVITRVDGAPVPPGYTAWSVGGSTTALPTLTDDAPFEVRARYFARVRANALGRCPLCDAVAGATVPDPTKHPAAFHVLPLTVPLRIEHTATATGATCPAVFTDDDRRWFDPDGMADTDDTPEVQP